MGLLSSFLLRPGAAPGAATEPDATDSVAQARMRARQRLIGAVVLVGIGVIAFPLLFETQPRPIPVDVAIDIPKRDNAPPLAFPAPRPAERSPSAPAAVAPVPAAPREPEVITETAAEAGLAGGSGSTAPAARTEARAEPAAPGSAARSDSASPRPDTRAETSTARAEPRAPARVDPPRPAEPPRAPADDGARARALLEGKPAATTAAAAPAAASAASTRYIVQIGAFADAALAQQTRLKVERLGLTTYTHIAQTPDGARTRVRVGPVSSRQDAEKVAARIKAAGLPAAILTL